MTNRPLNSRALAKALDVLHAEGELRISMADLRVAVEEYLRVDARDWELAEVRSRVAAHVARGGEMHS